MLLLNYTVLGEKYMSGVKLIITALGITLIYLWKEKIPLTA
jgi:hypothetical protein